MRRYQQRPASKKQPRFSVVRDLNNPWPCQIKRQYLSPLPSVVMSAVTPITYAEFYRVVTNNPHDGDPSAVYEDKTPVPVAGIRATPANIVLAVCGESNPDTYLLFTRGVDGVPYVRVLLQVTMCPCNRGRASSFAGAPIAQFKDIWLLGPTFVRLPDQDFYVKKAVVPVVAQMSPAYSAGGEVAKKLLGPFDILDDNTEEV